jgi:hydroxymethylglutaryl-CoA lyase
MLFGLRPDWLNPKNFADLVRLGESITSELPEDKRSKSALGARSKAAAFQWVMPS